VIVVGLTGSIGMGKTATAALFKEAGAAVHDADAEVARLYAPGGAAVKPVLTAFPAARGDNGGVDRARLSAVLAGEPAAFKRLEAIVHPLVAQARETYLARRRADGTKVVVLEIQLLFEIGADALVDKVVVVSAPPEVQRTRVLARPGMTPQKFELILARQTPDVEKRKRADFVITTDKGVDDARRQVAAVMAALDSPGEADH
jgi:dephospho-CoA kinase